MNRICKSVALLLFMIMLVIISPRAFAEDAVYIDGNMLFEQSEIELPTGKTYTLAYDVQRLTESKPTNIKYESSDPSVVTVSNGKLAAKKAGIADINVFGTVDGTDYYSTVSVSVFSPVTKVQVPQSLTIQVGDDPVQIQADVQPESAKFKGVSWASSDESVAVVDENGALIAVKAGKVKITATSTEFIDEKTAPKSASINVTVLQPVMEIELEESSIELAKGKNTTVNVAVLPEDATNKKLIWESLDNSIATVDSSGRVTAKGLGVTEIVCKPADQSEVKGVIEVEVFLPVSSVKIVQKEFTIHTNETVDPVEFSVEPSEAKYKDVKWVSSDESIATVSEEGKITGIKAGKATISVMSAQPVLNGEKPKSAQFIVNVNQPVEKVILSRASIKMAKGSRETLAPSILPADATDKKLIWTSSHEAVATVDAKGTVFAKGVGTAIITCKSADNEKLSASCSIDVFQAVTGLRGVGKNTCVIFAGKTQTLGVSVLPEDASNKKIKWSSDSSCAKVDDLGKVSGVRTGKATITAEATDGSGKKCTFTVYVEPACPVSVTGMGTGVYAGNLLGITFKNNCQRTAIKEIYFDITLYSYLGTTISSGSYRTETFNIGPGASKQLKRTLSGVAMASKFQYTITGVVLKDGTTYYIPKDQQEVSTWS